MYHLLTSPNLNKHNPPNLQSFLLFGFLVSPYFGISLGALQVSLGIGQLGLLCIDLVEAVVVQLNGWNAVIYCTSASVAFSVINWQPPQI